MDSLVSNAQDRHSDFTGRSSCAIRETGPDNNGVDVSWLETTTLSADPQSVLLLSCSAAFGSICGTAQKSCPIRFTASVILLLCSSAFSL